ncbi:MAG: chemotaxis protein CheW [Cyanobacteria bacterium]|nr:chemotaxis protein CheW [Cyanobacteria bacterium CG_2015-16_32_12]NCO76933.1 chemotaxis protein CheW [Cyanobacteria bacterium CG_2015-22_32_23]NCQ04280.1 chemotaxis protein CheW [Cyanobacteria bacterium CG_2015-09_32_10]NCQ42920.1 chemotaxis protein CheW [Cyanobacteria bacterium CG_2015-04_32_10]
MNTANLSRKQVTANTQKIKFLVFPIDNLNVALHIDSIKKIINYSTIFSSGLNHYGLVSIGEEEITVIDLHKRLFNTVQVLGIEDKKYLLLALNSNNETFGILIKNAPELYDIPLNQIRVLPPSYRRADTLKIASHVTVIMGENDEEKTIFILDPDELIAPV